MTYYLELAIDGMKQVERNRDWEGSWAKQVVTELEWEQAKLACADRFKEFVETLNTIDLSEPDDQTYAIANVGHAGYHLGAIRQLFLFAKSK